MAASSEKSITRQIIAYLRSTKGSWWAKIAAGPYQQPGLPDILGCMSGLFYAFEVKRPGGGLTPLQAKTLEAIRDGGGVTAVVHSVDEVQRVLRGGVNHEGPGPI